MMRSRAADILRLGFVVGVLESSSAAAQHAGDAVPATALPNEAKQQVALGSTVQEIAQRGRTTTLVDHRLVPPISIDGSPFEFSIPLHQIASQTTGSLSWISGDRNAEQGPADVTIGELSQAYHFSLRFAERAEVGASLFGSVASGTSGESIIVAGGAASAGGRLSAAYRFTSPTRWSKDGSLLPDQNRLSVLVRIGASYEGGYRANIEPLLYLVGANPLSVVGNTFQASWVGAPTAGFAYGGGIGAAYAISSVFSFQASFHADGTLSKLTPWLAGAGRVRSGPRDLTYAGWTPSGGIAFAMFAGPVLFQPQLGLSFHTESLTSETAVSTPKVETTSLTPILQIMYLAGSFLQIGGAIGEQSAWTTVVDPYANTYSTTATAALFMLLARYIPGWSQQ